MPTARGTLNEVTPTTLSTAGVTTSLTAGGYGSVLIHGKAPGAFFEVREPNVGTGGSVAPSTGQIWPRDT